MPAVPFLISAGGAWAGNALANRSANSAQQKASQRSPEELQFLLSQSGLMDTLKQQGSSLFANAMPGIRSTLNYYQTLLNGDRAARTAAVANEAEQVGQAYQGADQGVKQNLRGGERDQALEIGRAHV